MLDQIRNFFHEHILEAGALGADGDDGQAALRRAAAALLLEMTHMDEQAADIERAAVVGIVRECFDLDAGQAEELLACAEAERVRSTDYFQFTSLINDHFGADDKERLVEALWRVAYADDRLSKYEEYLVRKIAELLYVPHAVFIRARHRVALEHGRDI
jgi:uncharacterized tellurite resistance protein B-like protein